MKYCWAPPVSWKAGGVIDCEASHLIICLYFIGSRHYWINFMVTEVNTPSMVTLKIIWGDVIIERFCIELCP